MKNQLKTLSFILIPLFIFSCDLLQNAREEGPYWSPGITFELLDKHTNETLLGSDSTFRYHIDSLKLYNNNWEEANNHGGFRLGFSYVDSTENCPNGSYVIGIGNNFYGHPR